MFSSPICPSPPSIIKNRQLGFIIWQSIAAAFIHLTYSLFLRVLRLTSLSFRDFFVSFVGFLFCLLVFSGSLLLLYSPFPYHTASPTELTSTLLKSALKSCIGGYSCSEQFDAELWSKAKRSLLSVSFSVLCIITGFFSMVAACQGTDEPFVGLGIRGAVFGLVFSAHYLYRNRWLLKFPVIQRPLFYSFKRGFKSSFPRALKLSIRAYLCSFFILLFHPNKYKINGTTTWTCIISQINIFIGFFIVSYCWEISHHLLQVVHTRRCMFCPAQGSEQNPSNTLLEALEQSSPKSLLSHLTYLDLCMVSESNIESWRRAAFFEETGETYKRVVSACLRPIEHLVYKINDSGEMDLFSQQLMRQPFEESAYVKLSEAFDDFELCAWAARSLASLTARSRHEDRYGVAQLSSCNTTGLTALLSSLLAVESCLGKKTGIPDLSSFRSPQKFTTVMSTRKDKEREKSVTIISGKRREELNNKAYAMADVLRACIYQIVAAFGADMAENVSALAKSWIQEGKPLFGSRDLLVQKLLQFVEYRAV